MSLHQGHLNTRIIAGFVVPLPAMPEEGSFPIAIQRGGEHAPVYLIRLQQVWFS